MIRIVRPVFRINSLPTILQLRNMSGMFMISVVAPIGSFHRWFAIRERPDMPPIVKSAFFANM